VFQHCQGPFLFVTIVYSPSSPAAFCSKTTKSLISQSSRSITVVDKFHLQYRSPLPTVTECHCAFPTASFLITPLLLPFSYYRTPNTPSVVSRALMGFFEWKDKLARLRSRYTRAFPFKDPFLVLNHPVGLYTFTFPDCARAIDSNALPWCNFFSKFVVTF
jgi:hypothetical protein